MTLTQKLNKLESKKSSLESEISVIKNNLVSKFWINSTEYDLLVKQIQDKHFELKEVKKHLSEIAEEVEKETFIDSLN